MAWPIRYRFNLWAFFSALVGLVLIALLALSARDRWDEYRVMDSLEPVTHIEPEALEIGDVLWVEATLSTTLLDDHSAWQKGLLYGCTEVYDSSEDGQWNVEDYYFPTLIIEVDGQVLLASMPRECPQGDYEHVKSGSTRDGAERYSGYVAGQRLSLVGEITDTEASYREGQVVLTVDSQYGGSADDHKSRVFWHGLGFSICGVLGLLFFLVLGWRLLSASRLRHSWKYFATQNSLQYVPSSAWRLGEIHGEHRARTLTIARRRGAGDGKVFPADLCLRFSLNSCLKPYRMRHQLSVERWLGVIGGEVQIDDPLLDDCFVLKGADEARWRELLCAAEVRKRLIELQANQILLRLDEGWMELSWPGLDTAVLRHVMGKAMELADIMEQTEGRGWRAAAEVLGLDFEMGEQVWKLAQPEASNPWELQYSREEAGWVTFFQMRVHPDIPQGWQLRARDVTSDSKRTGDPVLDAQVTIEGLTDEELQALCRSSDSTEVLLAAICGQRLSVESGRIERRTDGLIAAPLELIGDAHRLAELLTQSSS